MKTKVVYSIVSSASDNYCEQLIMSLHSLRKHNPDACVEIVCDNDTAVSFAEGWRSVISQYSVQIIAFDTPHEYNNMERSRFLKTNLRKFVSGDYLFIDCDTIICGPLDAIDHIDAEIAACADLNAELNLTEKNTLTKIERAGLGDASGLPYFNSGVMLVKDTPLAHQLYEEWYHLWLHSKAHGVPQDQPALCLANQHCGEVVKELDGKWNCQFKFQTGYRHLADALIMHYFAAKEEHRFWNQPELMIYEQIRERHGVDDAVDEVISHPKTRLYNTLTLTKNAEFRLINSPLTYIYFQYPTLFSVLNKFGLWVMRLKYGKSI